MAGRFVIQPIGATGADIAALVDAARLDRFVECINDERAAAIHPHGVELHDEKAAVVVDDKAGKPIALTVYEAVGIGLGE